MTIRLYTDEGKVLESSHSKEQKERDMTLSEVTQQVYEGLSEEEKKEVDHITSILTQLDGILDTDHLLGYQQNIARVLKRIANMYRTFRIYKDPALVEPFIRDLEVGSKTIRDCLWMPRTIEGVKGVERKRVDMSLEHILFKIETSYKNLIKTKGQNKE